MMPKKNQRGFTLVETVIALGMFVLILLTLLALFDGYGKTFAIQQNFVNVANSAANTMNEMNTQVLQADHVVASHTFSGTTYSSNASTLVIEIPSIDSSGDIVSSKYDYEVFYSSGGAAYRIFAPDAASSRVAITKQLSNVLSSMSFTYDNASFPSVTKVTADIQTQKIVRGETIKSHLTQQINLRNN